MKTFLLFLFTGITCTSFAQHTISGIWEGKLNAGVSLRIVFHFDRQPGDTYKGFMDSPDQGAKGIPFSSVTVKDDSVIAEVKVVGGSFKGVLAKDSVISGSWFQQGGAYALTVYRVKEASTLQRPQTPKPPFIYTAEEVAYDNGDKSVHFGGTFTYPKGSGPFTTAILITGSGQQDRDETILGHKPFAVIADDLTRKGFAVLRVDDRGMGKTTGMVKEATSADFANDVEAGLAYLKTREEVDRKRIGLIGHSEGGLIASIVASRNKDISFVILLAGPGIKGADLLADQNEAILKVNGIPADAALAYKILFRKIIEETLTSPDSATAFQKAWADGLQWKDRQAPSILTALNIRDSITDKKVVSQLITAFSVPWMKYFLNSDPRPLIEKFHCKVLALDGSRDVQVIATTNLAGINSALKKSKSPVYETKELQGLNHLFQHCKKCTVNEYGELEETFAPEVLEIMSDWLQHNIQKI
jgi:pimeloyl-ACP methyl ester carboxylesterase